MADKVGSHNHPFCIIYEKDENFTFPRSEELACGPMYARAIFEKLTRVGNTDELLEEVEDDSDIDVVNWDLENERSESIEDLQQAIYCF